MKFVELVLALGALGSGVMIAGLCAIGMIVWWAGGSERASVSSRAPAKENRS
jgi:hypothetical protein